MKKAAVIIVILLLSALPLFAENYSELFLRFSRQGDHLRIVLQSDNELITDASSTVSTSAIRVVFPSDFILRKPDNFAYPVEKHGHSLTISLAHISDIKASRLPAPSRLIFDLTMEREAVPAGVPQVSPSGPQDMATRAEHNAPKGLFQDLLQKSPENQPIQSIVVDSGHGGYDYGIVTQEAKEKDVDLTLAKALNSLFSKEGKTVFLTRRSDQYESIAERVNFANEKNPGLFISVHASSSTDRFAVYVSTVRDLNVDTVIKQYSIFSAQNRYFDESRAIAQDIGESLKREFGNTVVIRELPLPILYSINAPAVLIEYPSLDLFGSAESMQAKFAASIANGISTYEKR